MSNKAKDRSAPWALLVLNMFKMWQLSGFFPLDRRVKDDRPHKT